MSTGSALAAIFVVGVLTYVSRAGLIVLLAGRTLHPEVVKALRYVGPAVLSALVVSFIAGGEGRAGIEGVEVAAVITTVAVVAVTRNLLMGVGAGMGVLWVLLALM